MNKWLLHASVQTMNYGIYLNQLRNFIRVLRNRRNLSLFLMDQETIIRFTVVLIKLFREFIFLIESKAEINLQESFNYFSLFNLCVSNS